MEFKLEGSGTEAETQTSCTLPGGPARRFGGRRGECIGDSERQAGITIEVTNLTLSLLLSG